MSPALGAWTQPDRLGMVDGPNVYGYVGSNPVLRVDPSGNIFIVPALIGGLIGGLTATLVGVISGQSGMELLQSFGQGVVIGMLAAIVPGMGAVSHELAAALSGAMVSAFSNLFGQFMDIFSGKKTWSDFSVGQFLAALAIGAVAGIVGGTFSPGSKLWHWVMDHQVPMLRDLWQATMAAAMLSGFIGGAGDVVSAIIRRQLMVEQLLADDRTLDIENQLCVPWSGR